MSWCVRFVSSRGARAFGKIRLAFANRSGAHQRLRLGGGGDVLANLRRGGPLRLRALSFATSLSRGDDGGWFVIEGARRGSRGGRDGDATLLERGVFWSRAAQADVSVGVGGVGGVGGSAEARRDGERAADVAGAVFGEPGGETRGRSTSSGRSVGADAPARPAGSSSSSGYASPSSGASAVMRASSASRASSSMSSPSSAMRRASARIAACASSGGGSEGSSGGKRATRVPSACRPGARGILGAHPAASRHRAPGRST